MDSGLCIYHLFEGSNLNFLHNSRWITFCDNPLRGPRTYQLLVTILSWPVIHLVVPIGVSHISLRHKKYNRGNGRKRTKNKRTIWIWVNSKCKKGSSVTLHSLCIYRLTLTCILREISTKPQGMLTHFDWSSLTAPGLYLMPTGLFCCPLSTAPLRHPSPTAFSGFLFPSLTGVPLPTSSHVEISSSSLCLVSRQNEQKDRLLGAPPS